MKTLERIDFLDIHPGETVVTAKIDGEFTVLHYTREGESYTLNKWGHRRTDFLALNQFVEAMRKTSVTYAELLCELHSKEDGKPTNLPTFIRNIKGKKRNLEKIHIGIWDLLRINEHTTKEPYFWKLEEVESWVKGCSHVSVVPYTKPQTLQDVKEFWSTYVGKQNYEGLVIRDECETYKIKPVLEVDAVIIGLNKRKLFKKKQITSIKLALMQPDGTFIELSDCASGITAELRTSLWKLMEYKVGEDNETVYVKPIVVCTIQYTETYISNRQVLRFEGDKYKPVKTEEFVSLRHPRLIRFRPDKQVDIQDLRTTQIPLKAEPLQFILYQDDCRRILHTLPSESIDLIITSPPYWKLKEYSRVKGEIGTEPPDQYRDNMLSVFQECYRLLKPDGLMMLNIDNGKREEGFITISAWDWVQPLREIGFNLTQTIIWVDTTRRPLQHPRLLDHHYEPVFILAKGREYTWNWEDNENRGDVWEIQHYKGYAKDKGDLWDRTGIATFPITLIEKLMKLGSKEGDWTLDVFAGSGTVMDTAQRLGRNNISIEINPEYCQTIMNRCFDKHSLHKYLFEQKGRNEKR